MVVPVEAARAVETPTAASTAPGHLPAGKEAERSVSTVKKREGRGGVGVVSAPSDKGASICARSWHLIE